MRWIFRLSLVGSGLLLLTLLAGLFWFIAIPVGLLALVFCWPKVVQRARSVRQAVNDFLDEPV